MVFLLLQVKILIFTLEGGWAVRGKGGKQARTGTEQVTVDVRRRLRDANVDSAT